MIYTLGKDFFAAATFRFVRRFFSDRVTKFIAYFGL